MPEPVSITALVDEELDRLYVKTAGNMLEKIKAISSAPGSGMQRALKELEDEAVQLSTNDKRLTIDNAHLQKALNEHSNTFIAAQALISENDNPIEEAAQSIAIPAVTAKVFHGLAQGMIEQGIDPLSPKALSAYKKAFERAGISWVTPSALDFAKNYVDSSEWLFKMEAWGSGYSELTREAMLNGLAKGWGPGYTASQMRRYAENMPYYAALNLTRTLQLTSYRDASAAMELVNGRYILGKIRIANLDNNTCLACIELHGTPLRPGERVNDHYRGRCSEFYQVPGGPEYPGMMQADSLPGQRNYVPYQSGHDWFNSLPESRQRQQASFLKSPAKWRAWKSGTPLSDFVGDHMDDVFGSQIIERSLLKALGRLLAESYYQANQ